MNRGANVTITGLTPNFKIFEFVELKPRMPSNGIIFSDGIETDFLNFNSGTTAIIGTAKEKAKLVTPDVR